MDGNSGSSPQPTSAPDAEQYLTFQLAGQDYGVEILRVQEIKGWEKPTRLPHSPEHIQGVINLRGTVVPIIDLRRRFGLGEGANGRTAVVIVVKVPGTAGEMIAGIVVDGVCEVCDIAVSELRPVPQTGATLEAQFVRGLAMIEQRMLVLLDVSRLVSAALGEAQGPTGPVPAVSAHAGDASDAPRAL